MGGGIVAAISAICSSDHARTAWHGGDQPEGADAPVQSPCELPRLS